MAENDRTPRYLTAVHQPGSTHFMGDRRDPPMAEIMLSADCARDLEKAWRCIRDARDTLAGLEHVNAPYEIATGLQAGVSIEVLGRAAGHLEDAHPGFQEAHAAMRSGERVVELAPNVAWPAPGIEHRATLRAGVAKLRLNDRGVCWAWTPAGGERKRGASDPSPPERSTATLTVPQLIRAQLYDPETPDRKTPEHLERLARTDPREAVRLLEEELRPDVGDRPTRTITPHLTARVLNELLSAGDREVRRRAFEASDRLKEGGGRERKGSRPAGR